MTTEPAEAREPPAHEEQAGSISHPPPVASLTSWTRVREHKVVQWLLAYAAAAYTLLHIVEMVGGALDWPHVVARIVTLGLFLGAPLVATLAWYHGHRALRWVSGPELAILTVLLFIAGGVLWFMGRPVAEHASGKPIADAPAPLGSSGPLERAPPETSIAVLPFLDMSEQKDEEYFADGMAEEVIDLLTKIPELRVIGRTSSFSFKGRPDDLRSIGEKLRASYLVEGSVRRANNRVRVTALLIDAHSGTHVWSEAYDRDFGDVLALQDQIASGIARALQLAVGADVREVRHLHNTEAYMFYLRGRSAIDRGDAGVSEAKTYFEQSLSLDPTFLRAAEALALAYVDEIAARVTSK
jgi:TolB-like protein